VRVAIDLTQIDNQTIGSGQYRYVADLVNGLIDFEPDVHLTLFGSTPAPRDEFSRAVNMKDRCRYDHLARHDGRGYVYRDILQLSARVRAARVDLLHQPHTYVPFPKPCPVVVTAYHYYDDPVLFATRPYRYYRWSLRTRVDAVIAISNATRDDFCARFGVPRERIRTVYCGLSASLAAGDGVRRGRPYILSPYNLSAPKNLRSLILAWPRIAARHPSLELVLYGRSMVTTEAEAAFEQLLASTAGADRVHRVGFVSDAALADLFGGCDLFVFPTTVEGFGYPLLEAMAHGACCVTRNASAMKEIAGDAACLVETLRPDEIADASIALLGDQPRRTALGRRAADRARGFTIEAMVRNTVACYRSVT
jgi:glycosyltransferase involved in cell wall biosynthesis